MNPLTGEDSHQGNILLTVLAIETASQTLHQRHSLWSYRTSIEFSRLRRTSETAMYSGKPHYC